MIEMTSSEKCLSNLASFLCCSMIEFFVCFLVSSCMLVAMDLLLFFVYKGLRLMIPFSQGCNAQKKGIESLTFERVIVLVFPGGIKPVSNILSNVTESGSPEVAVCVL